VVSASNIWRLRYCGLWPHLPHYEEEPSPDDPRRVGTDVHTALAALAGIQDPTADYQEIAALAIHVARHPDDDVIDAPVALGGPVATLVDRWWEWRWSDAAGWLSASAVCPEAAVAVDLASGRARLLRVDAPRAYPKLGQTEVPGSIDLALPPAADGGVSVADWKTTQELDLPHASEAWMTQLRVYALAWSALHDDADVACRLVQVGPDEVRERTMVLDPLDCAELRAELLSMLHRSSPKAPATPGSHCSGCPARRSCPAGKAVAEDAIVKSAPPTTTAADTFPLARPTNEAHAAWLYDRVRLARAYLDGVEAELRAWVQEQPDGAVVFPDGRRAGMVEMSERKIDLSVPGAFARLASLFGPERAEAIAPRRVSITSVEDAARAKVLAHGRAPRGAIKTAIEEAMRELECTGAVRVSTHLEFRVKAAPKPRRGGPHPHATPPEQLEEALAASLAATAPQEGGGL